MVWLSNKTHEKHLRQLENFSLEVVKQFARAAVEYIIDGPNLCENCDPQVTDADQARKIIESLVFLYLECCRADINAENVVKFLEERELSSQHIGVIYDEYRENKLTISKLCSESDELSYYQDMQWRFEAKVGSRSLLNQMVPLVSMDLKFSDSPNAAESAQFKHDVLQTDPTTLIRMADSLEKALNATRSRNVRKAEKEMIKLASDL